MADWADFRPVTTPFQNSSAGAPKPSSTILGPLEFSVIEVLWKHGEKNVRDVTSLLTRPLAYTTVMTTLDRLYKKGLLNRKKVDRAFFYRARFTQEEIDRQRAQEFMAPFLENGGEMRSVLVSCLIDSASQNDDAILVELERRIQLKREELGRNPRR